MLEGYEVRCKQEDCFNCINNICTFFVADSEGVTDKEGTDCLGYFYWPEKGEEE